MGPILLICLSKRFGGADVRVLGMAQALEGHHSYAVAVLQGSRLHSRLRDAQLNALPLPFGRGDPRLASAIYSLIRRFRFQIIDMHNPQSEFWGIIAAKAARGARTTINTVHSSRDQSISNLKSALYERVLVVNSAIGSRFIAVSNSVYDYLSSLRIQHDKIATIPNGLSLPANLSDQENSSLRSSFGWGNDNFLLVSVGRLERVKGHTHLLNALKPIVADHPQIRVLLVGDGSERKALERMVSDLNLQRHVRFTGFRNDVPRLLAASNAFCLPSLTEGMPFAVLEACMHQLPLVVTNVGGIPEFLTDRKTAILVPPADPGSLSKGVISLIENPDSAKAMGRAAQRLVNDHFSQEKMVKDTLAFYQGANVEDRRYH